MLRAALLLAAWQGAAGGALGQATPSTVDCAAIESDRERLICYDRASGRAGEPPASRPTGSLIDTAWAFDRASPRFVISLHNQNYLLVARYTDRVNTAPYEDLVQPGQQAPPLDSTEAKFQISFKARLWTTDDRRWGMWVAYTQQNQWQEYNSEISRPFRETNYMPEVFASYRPGLDLGAFQWRLLNFGYVHQSNGRTDVLSRSWDRLFVEAGVERGSFVLLARAWHRLKDASKDDNPDITDFYGHGSLTAVYKWRENSVSLTARGNLAKGKGAGQLTWMSPEILGTLRGYVQIFSGYGESLIDYNWKQSTIGIGIAVNDLF